MIVVRPKGILGTPERISDAVSARLRKYPNERFPNRVFDYRTDFFMTNVRTEHVRNAPDEYRRVSEFFTQNKYGQRRLLHEAGIPVPRVAAGHTQARELTGTRFVVRPLRHSKGQNYRVTENPVDFIPQQEYISELYPKKREYRVIFVYGSPLIVLRKKPNEGVSDAEPWGHENSRFQTINDVAGSRLAGTDCFWHLAHHPVIASSHIVAVDILYNSKHPDRYVVLEYNQCPGIDITGNLQRVVEAIRNHG